jgi:hypothetical protein
MTRQSPPTAGRFMALVQQEAPEMAFRLGLSFGFAREFSVRRGTWPFAPKSAPIPQTCCTAARRL